MAQLFDKVFPDYLAMGMTYEQFWRQDCSLVIAYRKAYKIRQEEVNRSAWLQGLYVYKALQSSPVVVQGFMKQGATVEPYPNKPINFDDFKPKTEQQKADDEARERAERIKKGMFEFMAAQKARRKEKELEDMLNEQ